MERSVDMIDFNNGSFVKLKKTDNSHVGQNVMMLLIDDESIVGTYKGVRDYVVFTNKRVISVNVQGITGKKQDYTSLPYSKITAFSIETAGVFDLDSELDLHFSGMGRIRFEFSGTSDILHIGRLISSYMLR